MGLSRRTGITDFNGRATTYTYDPLYRLTNETVSAGASDPAPVGSIGYILDKVGNRISRTVTGGLSSALSTTTSSYDSNDRLTTDSYDANGNTTTGAVVVGAVPQPPGSNTDVYDFENRLIRRTTSGGSLTIDSSYDADGNRIGETIASSGTTNTVTFLVDQLNPTGYAQVVEEKVNGLLTRSYAYGIQRISETQYGLLNGWSTSYFGYDGHGSVRELFDLNGNVTDTYTYDAFGTLINSTTTHSQPTFNRYLYVGEEYDSNLGLYYLRAPYMNADSGRFWSMDTLTGPQTDPMAFNKFAYVKASPTDNIDPTGNMTLGEIAYVSDIIGIYANITIPKVVAHVKKWHFDVETEIEDADPPAVPAGALGVKTDQSFDVDGDTGEVENDYEFTGRTFELIPPLSGFFKSIQKGNSGMIVKMSGWAHNLANPFLGTIEYSFEFFVNLRTGQIHLTGRHKGYPSYSVHTSRGWYYSHETTIGKLYGPLDVVVDKLFP